MHKLFKKGIAATMGLALSLTCLVVTAVPVKAAEKTYTLDTWEWAHQVGDANKVEVDAATKAVKVTLQGGGYNQVIFTIPEEIKKAGIESCTITMEGTPDDRHAWVGMLGEEKKRTSNYSADGVLDKDAAGENVDDDKVDRSIKDSCYVWIMNLSTPEDNEVVIKSVTFVTTNEIGGGASTDDKKEEDNKTEEKPADDKTETKPAETKPAETKPAETKPAKTADVSAASWMVLAALGCAVLLAGSGAVIMEQRKRR